MTKDLQLHLPLPGIAPVEFDGFTSADFELALRRHGFSVVSVGSLVGDGGVLIYRCKYPTKLGEVEVEFSLPEDYSAILGDGRIQMVALGIEVTDYPSLFLEKEGYYSPYFQRGAIAAEQLLLRRGILKNRRIAAQ